MNDLWGEVMQKCLRCAKKLLDTETTPTAATVEAVKGLVEVAISIEWLTHRQLIRAKSAERGGSCHASRQRAVAD